VAVFATTGEYVTGVVSATGNITGGNLIASGNLYYNGNMLVTRTMLVGVRVGNSVSLPLTTSGNITVLTRTGNVGIPSST
jgi:hypothetical protein